MIFVTMTNRYKKGKNVNLKDQKGHFHFYFNETSVDVIVKYMKQVTCKRQAAQKIQSRKTSEREKVI